MKSDYESIMEEDLHQLKDKMVEDVEYARDVYRALCNNIFIKNDKQLWSASWRYIGGIVADIRDEGEDYLDFYCSGNEGIITDEVKEDLKKLGWEKLDYVWYLVAFERKRFLGYVPNMDTGKYHHIGNLDKELTKLLTKTVISEDRVNYSSEDVSLTFERRKW